MMLPKTSRDAAPGRWLGRRWPWTVSCCVLTLLLAAGEKGRRYSLPHARIMIHQPMGGFQGQASDIEIQSREIMRLKQELNQILAGHTGQPLERISKDTDRDYYMTAREAVEYGLVDEVVARKPTKPEGQP